MPTVNGNPWSARAVVHPHPIYRVEGEPGRAGNGLYDTMQPVGAHEVIIENARHDRQLWNSDDREIEEYLALCAHRIHDLKKDKPLQVRERDQEFRQPFRAGVRPSHLGGGRHYVRSAPCFV